MKFSLKAGTATQIVTNIGILVGLAAVLYEVHQSRIIAQSQLMNEAFASAQNQSHTMVGEELAGSLARACYTPEKVTQKDTVVLYGHFDSLWYGVERAMVLNNLGFEIPSDLVIRGTTFRIAGSEPGRAWYQWKRNQMPEHIGTQADQVFNQTDSSTCADYLGTMLPSRPAIETVN